MAKSQSGKQRSNSNPGKKAALPRRNKTGKRPVKFDRWLQAAGAARHSRRSTIHGEGRMPIPLPGVAPSSPRKPHIRNLRTNPGKDLMSDAEARSRLRGANRVGKKKVRNPKK